MKKRWFKDIVRGNIVVWDTETRKRSWYNIADRAWDHPPERYKPCSAEWMARDIRDLEHDEDWVELTDEEVFLWLI